MTQKSRRRRSWFRMRRTPSRPAPRLRPAFDLLEDRLVPAGDITISTLTTAHIDVLDSPGVRTFRANSNNAVLNIDEITEALVIDDRDVIIETGTAGDQAGSINWEDVASLDVLGMSATHLLRLNFDPSGFDPVLILDADIRDSGIDGNHLDLEILGRGTTAMFLVNGFLGGSGLENLGNVTIDPGAGSTIISGDIFATDSLHFSARMTTLAGPTIGIASVAAGPGTIQFFGGVTVTAPTTLSIADGTAGSALNFENGPVLLSADLTVALDDAGDQVNVGCATSDGRLTELQVPGTHALTMPLGTLAIGAEGVLAGAGTVSVPDIQVMGTIAPGAPPVHTPLMINGDVTFQSGSFFRVGLGAASDSMSVNGQVTIVGGDIIGTGVLLNAMPVTLISALNPLKPITGNFDNAMGNVAFGLGSDAVTANYGGTVFSVTQIAGGPNTQTFLLNSGDLLKVQLTGPGPANRLVVIDEGSDGAIDLVVARQTKAKNTLKLTVIPNGGTGSTSVVHIGTGGLAKIIAPAVSTTSLAVNGKVGRVTLLDVSGTVDLGQGFTRLTARVLQDAHIQASGLNSLTAASVLNSTIQVVQTIGKLTVKAPVVSGLAPDFIDSSLVVGNLNNLGTALGRVAIAGKVERSNFQVTGSINAFSARKFLDSGLFVDYFQPDPDALISQVGTFVGVHRINSFTTTAVPFPSAAAPITSTLSFAGSQVVAPRFGTVRLSGVDAAGSTPFGLKVRDRLFGLSNVRVAAPAPPFNPKANLSPGDVPVAGMFFYLAQP